MNQTRKGIFITIEGGEGSGKSTAIHGIANWLREQGREVMITREPGGVHVSEQIRAILVNEEMDPLTEAILFAASRNEITTKLIQPALQEGKVVICDRFVDSSYVYQGLVRGLGLGLVEQINQPIMDKVQPDLTFYFDIEPEVGLERILQNHRETNKFDKEQMSFHYQVRDSYRALSQMGKYTGRIVTIQADQTPEKVIQDCVNVLKEKMLRK